MVYIKNIAKIIVEKLEKENVKYIFGYPGEQVLPLYEELRKSNIKHILVRHEQSAIHAADSYSRITGNPGVCIATAGPGAMNLVMGVSVSYKDNSPVIIITGDVPTTNKDKDMFQDIDINGVFKPITLKSYNANTPHKAQNAIDETFNTIHEGITGPIHINVPKDVQNMQSDIDHTIIKTKKIDYPKKEDINTIINTINKSENPIIIAGSGIIYANAITEIKEFIKKTKIPLTTTYPARAIIPEKDIENLGLIGTRGTKKSKYASENTDCILAFGTRLSERTIQHIKTDNIIQINTKQDPLKAKYSYKYNIKQVLKELNKKINYKTNNTWIKTMQTIENTQNKIEKTEHIHPEKAIQTIMKIINKQKNITITNDAGTHTTYTTINSILQKPSQLIFSGGLGPMGYGLPSAIGAHFARPQDTIITIVGDGDIQMTIQELATIREYNMPIIIIIINNNKLGIIKQWQNMNYNNEYEINLKNPDFITLAKAYNIKAKQITKIDTLEENLKKTLETKKPYLFDIIVEDIHIPLPK